jgi:release factor glutamine methyltransferase
VTTEPPSVSEALAAARSNLAGLPDADPALDAEVLLAHVLGRDRSWLYAWGERRLEPMHQVRFDELVRQRARGVPIAHLTGTREFWSLPLAVTPDTLIPRPDTELLVEWALQCVPVGAGARVLDLGTGSGAVALALASELPRAEVIASDRSLAALRVAASNARRLGLPQVGLLCGDWLAPLDARPSFDLIVSNPPYVAAADPHLGRGDVAHEPRAALAAGPTGLDALRTIIAGALTRLQPGGFLLLEHGAAQAAAVRALLRAAGYTAVATRRDLAGRERASGGRRPENLDAYRA